MRTTKIIFIAVLAALVTACGGDKVAEIKGKIEKLKKQQSEIKAELEKLESELVAIGGDSSKKVKVKDISVLELSPKDFKHYLEVQGRVESDKNVLLSAKAAGTITKILVNKGDYVRAGSTLATIDDEAMRKGVQELQTNLDLSKTVYEKQKALWDQKIGSEIQFLQAKSTYESLQKRMAQMNEQLDMYKVKATIEGTVDEIYPNEGELTAPGAPVIRIINTSGFKVTAEIAEGYIDKIKRGNLVEVFFPDINYTMQTSVKVVSDVISPTNRTFLVEFDLRNAPSNLKANMIAYVKILDYTKPSSIVVPVNIVQHSESSDFVYVAKGNKAVKTNVKSGSVYRNDAEILSGLNAGDKVVTVGYQDMVDGQIVKY